jgi:putative transposase
MEVHRTYKYRIYKSKNSLRLHDALNISGIIWNHITALQKRYYRLFGKHFSESRMKRHIAFLRMKTQRYSYWRKLGSQAVQEICERHEGAYNRFFNKKGGLPRFKKVKKYSSFTLKQKGWKLGEDNCVRGSHKDPKYTGHIYIFGKHYKFVKHRPLRGKIRTITIKRDVANQLWICFSVIEEINIPNRISTGKSGGFDFGLKNFLTTDEGQTIDAPQFFKFDLPRLRQIQRQVSKKVKESRNRQAGQQHLARRHIRIADKRRDFHFQLAHQLCDIYDILIFETLSIEGMKARWGRKVSDLAFNRFITIVQWVARKRGKWVIFIDRWEPTTKKCSQCGYCQQLPLSERTFCCPQCGLVLDRDQNAARNILALGHQRLLSQSV